MPTKVLSLCRILTICFFISFKLQAQQSDSTGIEIPEQEYTVERYDSILQLNLIDYHYGHLWDLDNDGLMDEIRFISNGGAHCYYHLQLRLSSRLKAIEFVAFQIDMPYLFDSQNFNDVVPFLVMDFNQDGIDEVYLNLNNHFAQIPDILRRQGISSNKIIINCANDRIEIRDYKAP